MKDSIYNLCLLSVIGFLLVIGCSGSKSDNSGSTSNTTNASAPSAEKPVTISSKDLTKAYDDNEVAADQKFKDKTLIVNGKIENIAETFGNLTVSLQGHSTVLSVMCSFEEPEKESVSKLKKGQQTTLIGTGDGMTAGLYVGLKKCKVQ